MRHLPFFVACLIASLYSTAQAETIAVAPSQQAMISKIERHVVTIPKADYVPYSGDFKAEFPDGFPLAPGSGLALKARHPNGSTSFWFITDRGPNGDFPDIVVDHQQKPAKVFPSPTFIPLYGEILFTPGEGARITTVTPLKFSESPASGLPVPPGKVGATGEIALNDQLKILPDNSYGLDPEGIVQDANDKLWIVDEYGPFLMHVDSKTGKIEKKLAPGEGLPAIIATRQPNRGFEAVAVSPSGKVYAAVQSTLATAKGAEKHARFTRIVEYDPSTGKARMLAYPLDADRYKNFSDAKIGDMVALDDHRFLLIEQGKQADKTLHNSIYLIDISDATDLTGRKTNNGTELEEAKPEELAKLRFVRKHFVVNLRDLGWKPEKAEGLALIDDTSIAIVNDNDFGLDTTLEKGMTNEELELANNKSKAKLKLGRSNDATELWVISFQKSLKDISGH